MAEKPKNKFKAGSVSITEFTNKVKLKDGKEFEVSNFVVQRSYKDKQDKWDYTNSFRKEDLIKLSVVLNETIKNSFLDDKEE
jgi:hypothetical protein